MKGAIRSPCASCPYRKDAKVAFWDRVEFENLLAQNEDEMRGHLFGCHEGRKKPEVEKDFCAGWLLDQKQNGLPSLRLRLHLLRHPTSVECFEQVSDGGHELFHSVEEMAEANFPGITRRRKRL